MVPESPLDAAGRLRHAGLRVTAPRLAVLAALPDGAHRDVDTIARVARERLGTLSTQAVYDTLRTFTDAGLVRRSEAAGSAALYETRVGDSHHVVCRRCGTTVEVDCAVGRRPCLAPATTYGFVLDEAEVTFWGLCRSCLEPAARESGRPGQRGKARPRSDERRRL